MSIEAINASGAPPAVGPYSHAVRTGDLLFCSGQIALREDGSIVEGDVAAQTLQILGNIRAVLAAVGLRPQNIVKSTIFLSSMDHFAAVNQVYGSFFEGPPPARSTVAVAGLPKNVDVEIEVIASFSS